MKGQSQVINEIILFAISATVIFSAALMVSFSTNALKAQTQREQYVLVGDLVSMSAAKVYICGKFAECEVRADIPQMLSDARYAMTLSSRQVEVANFETDSSAKVPTPDFKRNIGGYVTSNSRYFLITSDNMTMLLGR